jgi:hypothetical protein
MVVDPDTVLACAIALEGFEAIARRNAQVVERRGTMQHGELAHDARLQPHPFPNSLALEQALRVLAGETPDHVSILTCGDTIGKR